MAKLVATAAFSVCALWVPAAHAAGTGWQPPRELSSAGSAPLSLAATAGFDARGSALVAWHSDRGVQIASRRARGPFSAAKVLTGSRFSMADLRPELAFDPGGGALALWSFYEPHPRFVEDGYAVDYTFGLRVASRGARGAFARPQTLTGALDADPSADVAIDSKGAAVVIWTDEAGMHAAARGAGRSRFGRAEIISQTQADPQVGVSSEARVAAWAGPGRVRAAEAGADSAFASPKTLPIAGLGKAEPQIAVDGRSRVTAAWATDGRVLAATCSASGRCGRARVLSATGEKATAPRVAVASDGTAVIAWRSQAGVSASSRRGHGRFGSARVVGKTAGGERVTDLSVSMSTTGDAAAVWTAHADRGDVVRAAVRRGSSRFLPARAVSAAVDGAVLSDPQIVFGPGGNALAVWGAMTDGRPLIQAAAFNR